MKTDNIVEAALGLLETLTAAPQGRMAADDLARTLNLTPTELTSCLEAVANLANRETGARAVVYHDGDDIVLMGDAARLMPLRLSVDEGFALAAALDALNIDHAARERIARALLPLGELGDAQTLVGGAPAFGPWYQTLQEAVRDGVRVVICYRSHGEQEARERLVDPHAIDVTAAAAYLIAWDVERDGERRYRLERVADVRLTDDSVVPHLFSDEDVKTSLERNGLPVTLSLPSSALSMIANWAGVETVEACGERPDHVVVRLNVTSRAWLFDQVLAQGGDGLIVEPRTLRTEVARYARDLMNDCAATV